METQGSTNHGRDISHDSSTVSDPDVTIIRNGSLPIIDVFVEVRKKKNKSDDGNDADDIDDIDIDEVSDDTSSATDDHTLASHTIMDEDPVVDLWFEIYD